ncbi:MAG: MFS transporter [Chloroflexi bacterium]|nr:MAG: MFS transporter [Chloroflexota bacterium]
MLDGLLTVALAYTSSLWLALVIWGLGEGFGVLFNINTASLRQAVVPNHMLGRIISIAMVLAWSAQPLGALAGGFLIERTGDVRLIYAVIGAVTFLIALVFRVASPLGRAERYLAPASAAAE